MVVEGALCIHVIDSFFFSYTWKQILFLQGSFYNDRTFSSDQ